MSSAASALAMACSRAPEPTIRIRTATDPIRGGRVPFSSVARARIPDGEGDQAVAAAVGGDADRAVTATAVRYLLQLLGERYPGGAVEVRVPPFGAVQCIEGLEAHPRHARRTSSRCAPEVWLHLATGQRGWSDAMAAGAVQASGSRADLVRTAARSGDRRWRDERSAAPAGPGAACPEGRRLPADRCGARRPRRDRRGERDARPTPRCPTIQTIGFLVLLLAPVGAAAAGRRRPRCSTAVPSAGRARRRGRADRVGAGPAGRACGRRRRATSDRPR